MWVAICSTEWSLHLLYIYREDYSAGCPECMYALGHFLNQSFEHQPMDWVQVPSEFIWIDLPRSLAKLDGGDFHIMTRLLMFCTAPYHNESK